MNRATSFLVYALLPYLGAFAGARSVLARGSRRLGPGPVTTVLLVAVGVPSLVGLLVPPLRHALERDADRIAGGQLWRLVTALVQQDSGVAGTVGNLAALLILGSVAEHLLGGRRTVIVFLAAGILAQLPALVWQPVGAGNSVANFGLAGAVALRVILDERRIHLATAAAALTLLAGVGLTVLRDVHGPAVLIGAAACFSTGRAALWPPRPGQA